MTASELAAELEGGRRSGGGWQARCPAHDDERPSLSIDDGDGGRVLVRCFAGCEQASVIAALRSRGLWGRDDGDRKPRPRLVQRKDQGRCVMPVPESAPAPPDRHPTLGRPSMRWPYRDANRRTLGFVHRFNDETGKNIRPLTYWTGGEHGDGWRWKTWPTPRPLCGLDRLARRPDAPVLICEGEKATATAHRMLPELVAVTSPGGSAAAGKADWGPLAGRKVVVWPDHDKPGWQYATDVARLALAAGAKSVRVVTIECPDEVPVGWDLADPLPGEWTLETIRQLLADAEEMEAEAVVDPAPMVEVETSGPAPTVVDVEIVEPTPATPTPTIPAPAPEATCTVADLLASVGITALTEASTPEDIELALRALADAMKGGDSTRRAVIRGAAVKVLKAAKISSPAALVDAATQAIRSDNDTDTGQGTRLMLADREPWPDPVCGAELLDNVAETIVRYVVLPDGAREAVALWVVWTYLFQTFDVAPLLVLTSPQKRCGKTSLLSVLEALVQRPLPTANTTTAVLFRIVEAVHPTLLIDEADSFLRENEDLRGIINAGHRRDGGVLRCVGDDHEPRVFNVFSPKAIAAIGKLPDTIVDRAIVVPMKRRTRSERVERVRLDRLAKACEPLARQAARWAADHATELRESDPSVPAVLGDRAADNWRCLFAIADLAGAEWPKLARRAAVLLSATDAAGEDDAKVLLLADLRDMFDGRESMASADIVATLVAKEDRPWPEWRRGKPLTTRSLARLLSAFSIRPKTIRDGCGTAKGYMAADMLDAWKRYLPAQGGDSIRNTVTNVAAQGLDALFDPSHTEALLRIENDGNPCETTSVTL